MRKKVWGHSCTLAVLAECGSGYQITFMGTKFSGPADLNTTAEYFVQAQQSPAV